MQASLFEPEELERLKKKQPREQTLIISSQAEQPLSPQQQSFNRLVKKIEKLRGELEKTTADLDRKLDYYGKYIHPLEQNVVDRRNEVVKLVFSFYNKRKLLSGEDKLIIKNFLEIQLEDILAFREAPDDDLRKIFQKVKGMSMEEAEEDDFELMKDEMQDMFESEGYDVDFTDFKKDMTQEEMMAKLTSVQEEFLSREQAIASKTKARKKTAKQLEKEQREAAMEEARNKNISSLYRQLAKALHPDLEQDEHAKQEKEVLMKRLTTAYNSGDLHSMLSLELDWLYKEEESFAKISKEKIAIYCLVLKEQIKDLEQQKFDLVQHPRYYPIHRYNLGSLINIRVNLPIEKRKLEETENAIEESISILKGKNAMLEIKTIIRQFEDQLREEDVFSFLEWDDD